MNKKITVDIIAILFMILFIYTSVSKLIEYSVFKEQLSESTISAKLIPIIAIGLPSVELIASILLLIPKWRLVGFIVSLILMIAFTIYVAFILSSDEQHPCSCGGILAELSWPQHLILNISFIVLAIAGIILERNKNIISIAQKVFSNNI
jgi:uncharacterized membrane protein YphA (DoxX/SURF4 family)